MFGHQYYWGLTRKYVIYFGTLFNDIVITRQNPDGDTVDAIKVPLTYLSKDRMLARVIDDPNLDKEAAITLPRMSFEYHNYTYDGERKLNTLGGITRKDTDVNKFMYMYNPVPVNLDFSLYIYVKNNEDAAKIVEQILPFFRPDWTAKINLIPEIDYTWDIPVIFTGSNHTDVPYSTNLTERRVLIWTLNFTMKGLLFGPIKKRPIIKFSNTQFYFGNPNENTQSDVVSQVQVTPGLLANGDPTTNASLSISPLLIDIEDDWDYAVQHSGLIIVEE